MQVAVLFPEVEIILHFIELSIDTARHFIGDAEEFSAVKAVISEQEPERHSLQYKEREEGKVAPDEEKYISHVWCFCLFARPE